jgi:hypothetical protein
MRVDRAEKRKDTQGIEGRVRGVGMTDTRQRCAEEGHENNFDSLVGMVDGPDPERTP